MTNIMDHHVDPVFFGTTTVGVKGQAVIPIEAREKLKIHDGDKLLVFGLGGDTLMLSQASHLEELANHLSEKLLEIKQAIKSAK